MQIFRYIAAILLLFACSSSSLVGQHTCASDEIHNIFLSKQKNLNRHTTMEDVILKRLTHSLKDGEICVVPVVIHVIENNGNISVAPFQAEQAIEWLNLAFADEGQFATDEGVAVPIEFCLAKRDPDNNSSTGINVVSSPLTDMVTPNDDEQLKELIVWDTERYLNVWVVNSITGAPNSPGVVGYATFPDSHGDDNDGVVMEANYFGELIDDSGVLIHEVGHYMGLYHTFQSGCPNDNCQTSGDKVCDTPPDEHLFNNDCFDGTNSCQTDEDDESENNPYRPIVMGGLGDQSDMQVNYMDYAGLDCMENFTPGQSDRMLAALLGVRSSLLDGILCFPSCDGMISVEASQSADEIEVGGSVIFENLSVGQTSLEWVMDGEIVSTDDIFEFFPESQGEYEINLLLFNDDIGCAEQINFSVNASCSIEIDISSEDQMTEEDGTISFESTSDGLESIEWYVGDVLVGTGPFLEHTFSGIGLTNVYAVGSNGVCEVYSNLIQISVGSCTTGKENNHWKLISGDSYFTMNFNGIEPEIEIDWSGFSTLRAVCTISDDQGDFLYHSANGVVYDSNMDTLQNGNGIITFSQLYRNSIFLKNPYNSEEYYLFSIGDGGDGTYPLYYSMIDATANNGLGAVTAIKNEFIVDPENNGSMNIINHCNTVDKWLVYFNFEVESFMAHLIDENGISPDPVQSPIGDVLWGGAGYYQIHASQRGDLAIFRNHLVSFDQETGVFELIKELGLYEAVPGGSIGIWALEISPEGKYAYAQYLYSLQTDPVTLSTHIVQIDLFATEVIDPANYYVIEEEVISFGFDKPGIRVAPNGKIYLAKASESIMYEINYPDSLGDAMGIEEIIMPDNAPSNWDFGNSFGAYNTRAQINIVGEDLVCLGAETAYSVNECLPNPVEWMVEGPAEIVGDENNAVVCSFSGVGTVQLIAHTSTICGELTDTLSIEIEQAPELHLGPNTGYCLSDPVLTFDMGSEFDAYEWSTGSTDQVLVLDTPDPQLIQATGFFGDCYVTDEIEILGPLPGEIDLGLDTDLCDATAIILDAGEGFLDYTWQDGSGGQTYTAFLGGDYFVTATMPCFATDTIYVDECGQTIDQIPDGLNNSDLIEEFVLYPNPSSTYAVVEWESKGSAQLIIEVVDILGQIVERRQIDVRVGKNRIELNTAFLANAQYFIVLRNGDFQMVKRLAVLR